MPKKEKHKKTLILFLFNAIMQTAYYAVFEANKKIQTIRR